MFARNNYTRTLNVAAASNRLMSWSQGDDATQTAMDFDANGNLQALCPGQPLAWNSRNQLDCVVLVKRENRADDTEHYAYDSSGQRVRKIKTTHTAAMSHTEEARYLPGLEIRTRHNERLEVITLQAGAAACVTCIGPKADRPGSRPINCAIASMIIWVPAHWNSTTRLT